MAFVLSSVFTHQGEIPSQYTCEGSDISPPLSWSGTPEGTKSLALIVDDPDAPDPKAPQRTWVHWVLYNLPPTASALAERLAPEKLPSGTGQGKNDWGRTGYGGPCPPIGRHRYFPQALCLGYRAFRLGNTDQERARKSDGRAHSGEGGDHRDLPEAPLSSAYWASEAPGSAGVKIGRRASAAEQSSSPAQRWCTNSS